MCNSKVLKSVKIPISGFIFKIKVNVFGILRSYEKYVLIIRINSFRRDLTDISARIQLLLLKEVSYP